MQPRVIITGENNLDYTITCAINSHRFEFFIVPDRYQTMCLRSRVNISNGWYNKTVTDLVQASTRVLHEGRSYETSSVRVQNGRVDVMSNKIPKPADCSSSPSKEYPFTLIAPEAQRGLVYQGSRIWHKTAEDAIEYSKIIYNANKDQIFALVVVQAVTEVSPKPQVELITSSFS